MPIWLQIIGLVVTALNAIFTTTNTVKLWRKDRLNVKTEHYFSRKYVQQNPIEMIFIKVINHSWFPINVTEVGLIRNGERHPFRVHELPLQIASRDAKSFGQSVNRLSETEFQSSYALLATGNLIINAIDTASCKSKILELVDARRRDNS